VVFVPYGEDLSQPSPPTTVTLTPEQFETAAHGEIRLREGLSLGPAVRQVRAIVFDAELGAVGSVMIPVHR